MFDARPCLCGSGSRQLAIEEIANGSSDLLDMRLQCKVSCIVKMHFGIGVIPLKSFGARRQEERVVLSPDGQKRWQLRAEVFLKFGIQGYVVAVIQEQIELDLVIPGSSQES